MLEFVNDDVALLLPFVVIGFLAQAMDGALGMAFGVIVNSILVGFMGMPPARASTQVHIVKIFTTAASGLSHYYEGNVDFRLFFSLLIPGILAGIVGAFLLSYVHGEIIAPIVLVYLLLVGIWLLIRGIFTSPDIRKPKHVALIGSIGGFLDAIGGGGWGPVVTSSLMVQGGEPRKVVGTVNSVEFFLTVVISATFIAHLGISDLLGPTLGLLIGGIIAAPFGAIIAKNLKPKIMFILVGVVLSLTSLVALYQLVLSSPA